MSFETGPLDPWLLDRLVCPATRTALRYDEAGGELISDAAGLAYPIRNGIPVMVIDLARRLHPSDNQESNETS